MGNHVLNRNDSFQVSVTWKIDGLLRPLWLAALGGSWNVQLFAESLGGGPEILLASDNSVAADPAVANYSVTLNIPPNALDEGDPGSNAPGAAKRIPRIASCTVILAGPRGRASLIRA